MERELKENTKVAEERIRTTKENNEYLENLSNEIKLDLTRRMEASRRS